MGYRVSQCVTHKLLSSHGYIWLYTDDPLELTEEYCYNVRHSLNFICNKPFYQIDKNRNIVKEYNCFREAKENGFNQKMISDCLQGFRNTYKNHIWIYKEQYKDLTLQRCKKLFSIKSTPKYYEILQYNSNNVLIHKYSGLNKIPSEYNKTNVRECCIGRKTQYKGYIWKYGEETINPTCKKVEMYNKDTGELLNVYMSLSIAEEETGIGSVSINNVCNHKQKTAGGYIWKYTDDETIIDKRYIENLKVHGGCKPLYVYDKNKKLINKYLSIKSAVEDGYNATSIKKCCDKEMETYRNLIWSYKEVS